MTTQPDQPADPIGANDTPRPSPPSDPTSAPASSEAADPVQGQLDELRALVGQLSAELATRPPAASPVGPATSTAPSGGPTPAAVAGLGAPSHAMHTADSVADALEESGPVIRYNVPAANGGDPMTGYGLVIGKTDVQDVAVSVDGDGNVSRKVLDTTHPEYIVARLDVLGVRLQPGNIVDEDASTRVQQHLDAQAG